MNYDELEHEIRIQLTGKITTADLDTIVANILQLAVEYRTKNPDEYI